MSQAGPEIPLEQRVRTLQIIVVSLVLGALFLMGWVLFQRHSGGAPEAPETPIITYVALAHGFLIGVAYVFIPGQAAAGGRRALTREMAAGRGPATPSERVAFEASRLAGLFVTQTIVAT